MPKKTTRWKLAAGTISTIEFPAGKEAQEIRNELAAFDKEERSEALKFWAHVLHVDSEKGHNEEADILKLGGWVWHATGWRKDGLPLLSEAGFHADRDSHALHEYNCCIRSLARLADGLPETALPAIRAAFIAGHKRAEILAYKPRGVGAPSQKDAVAAAMLHARRLWMAKNTGEPIATELMDDYEKIRNEHGAPAYTNTGTFQNRYSDLVTARGIG